MARSAVEQLFKPILQEGSPEALRAAFIATARAGIAEFIARQEDKPSYIIKVNGNTVSSEDAVPFGSPATITYEIQRLAQVGRFEFTAAVALSPPGPTGRYKNAWFILADGVETSPNLIPANVRVLFLINDEPYAGKIQIRGARLQGIPPGILERVRQLTLRRYGGLVTCDIEYHTLKGGYILKTNSRRHRAGEQLRYPTLVTRSRV